MAGLNLAKSYQRERLHCAGDPKFEVGKRDHLDFDGASHNDQREAK